MAPLAVARLALLAAAASVPRASAMRDASDVAGDLTAAQIETHGAPPPPPPPTTTTDDEETRIWAKELAQLAVKSVTKWSEDYQIPLFDVADERVHMLNKHHSICPKGYCVVLLTTMETARQFSQYYHVMYRGFKKDEAKRLVAELMSQTPSSA